LSDTLENGAGYSTRLGQPSEFNGLLTELCGPNVLGILNAKVRQDDHGHACQTSCHECMRDYSNLAYHSILDWRLGIDMARLALNAGTAIDFTAPHWMGVPQIAIQRLHAALPGSTILQLGGLPAVQLGPRAIIACHPMWDSTHPAMVAAQTAATAASLAPEFRSTFMMIRRPV
jgi:DEAD/DEAH box helicase domain-containing protein